MKELIDKYNVPGPRYTSYPTVPNWSEDSITTDQWTHSVKAIHSEDKGEGLSIYIHLPFCESLCTFCGCHKHITRQHDRELPYIHTVLKEWQLYLDLLPKKPTVAEVHLGGGTPTFFSPENLAFLMTEILKTVNLLPEAELGFEGHPNNTTEEHLRKLHELGFKRVSFGVQDYAPHVQEAINRKQSFEQVKHVHTIARSLGYDSISHDLVFGLPKQRMEDILETVRLTNKLRPDRISLYSYAHVPWIKGVGQRGFDESDLPSGEEKRKLYEAAKEELLKNGYYEIGMDHFALRTDALYKAWKKGTLHRNFMGYTTNTTRLMIGLGMSSISDSWYGFAQNVKSVKEYTELVEKGQIPIFRGHELSSEDLEIRRYILDLMCQFKTRLGNNESLNRSIMENLRELEQDGLVELKDRRIKVTNTGRVFIRNICMAFDRYLAKKEPQKPTFSSTI